MNSNSIKQYFVHIFLMTGIFLLSGCALMQSEQRKSVSLKQFIPSKIAPNSLIAAEILRKDIDQLVARVIEIHPEPFAIISSQQFHQQAKTIKQSIQYPLSRSDFFIRIAPLIAGLSDIHSHIELPQSFENANDKLFPLAVLYEGQALYVASDLSPHPKVPVGAIVTSINGVPINFLLQVMKRLTVKETDAGQRRKIQINFPWLLTAMGYAKATYQVSYLWNNQSVEVQVDGLAAPKNNIDASNHPPAMTRSFYGYSKLGSDTALLWLNDFNENPQIFKTYIDNQFKLIDEQGIDNLIIDVRYNDGGLSQNIKTLLSHLSSQPISWSQRGEIKISQPLQNLHQKRTKERRKNKFSWGLQWLPLEWTDSLQYKISWSDTGEKISVDFENIETSELPPPARVIVLTNGFCYSACSSFIAAINYYSLAETMGEVTGSFAKVQYAYPIRTKLHHSQLELVLPTMKLIFDKKLTERKQNMAEERSLIKPKTPLIRTIEQITNKQDALLNQALTKLK